jgi:hypothetical protein
MMIRDKSALQAPGQKVFSPVVRTSAQLWQAQLAETAPLIRAALARLHEASILITTHDDVPVTSGKLVVVGGLDGPLLPSLMLDFSLRGINFSMEVPLGSVFRVVASWNGQTYVFRLPEGERLQVDWPTPDRFSE